MCEDCRRRFDDQQDSSVVAELPAQAAAAMSEQALGVPGQQFVMKGMPL